MATIAHALSLAAERAIFLVMTGHYENFSRRDGSFELWVKATSTGENNKKFLQNITIFSITERRILAYRFFFSMSDEESPSKSDFYYPEEEEQAKTEQNNMTKVTTYGDQNISNSQEELQKFVHIQKSENTVKKKRQVIWSVFTVFLAR